MSKTEDLCSKCDGRCCKYVAIEIDEPEDAEDFDTLRWYVSHEGCSVYREESKWYFDVETRCEHLSEGNKCAIYPRRPDICFDHATDNCEMSNDDFAWDMRLETIKDVEDYARLALRNKRTRNGDDYDPPWEKRARKHNPKPARKKAK